MIRRAHIIAIGDEVLSGETINTNAAWMARFLMEHGVRPEFQCVVPDQEEAIAGLLKRSLEMADLVVMMGGLGPTADDRTIEATGKALGRLVSVDPRVLDYISHRHSHAAGWQASVKRQARIIHGATVWLNPTGQAPGQLLEQKRCFVALLPGPPGELESICLKWMGPWLETAAEGRIQRDSYSVFDWGESAVASYLTPLLEGHHPNAGIYAQPGRIDVRIDTSNNALGQVMRERSRAWIISKIPGVVYQLGDATREQYLISWLTTHAMSVTVMESLTGGLLLSQLIDVPGASECVLGGEVAYTDEAKRILGVPSAILESDGAVSGRCAEAMAEAVRDRFQSHIGVSTTGFAGPGGGTDADPAGTFYVATVGPMGSVVRRRYAPLARQAVRQVAVQTAMSAVWELLKLPTLLNNLTTI